MKLVWNEGVVGGDVCIYSVENIEWGSRWTMYTRKH